MLSPYHTAEAHLKFLRDAHPSNLLFSPRGDESTGSCSIKIAATTNGRHGQTQVYWPFSENDWSPVLEVRAFQSTLVCTRVALEPDDGVILVQSMTSSVANLAFTDEACPAEQKHNTSASEAHDVHMALSKRVEELCRKVRSGTRCVVRAALW
eukprot:936755-Amphidinium_carterae.1